MPKFLKVETSFIPQSKIIQRKDWVEHFDQSFKMDDQQEKVGCNFENQFDQDEWVWSYPELNQIR